MAYEKLTVNAPRSAGFALRMLVGLAESPLTRGLIARIMLPKVGITAMRATPSQDSAVYQVPRAAALGCNQDPVASAIDFPTTGEEFPLETAADFVSAYKAGRTTPTEVARRFVYQLKELDSMTPPMRLFIAQDEQDLLMQAAASTRRYESGQPLGPLDGVPVAVKDELNQAGYPTTVGTKFLGTTPEEADATPVARLRAAGALLVGKTNMHEIGIGVTGLNPHHGVARNPHDPRCATGGSSSGSAAAVASGLCPIAVGADGGGSIRIPASFCGVLGLKPTFGRVSEHGVAPVCWSVAHAGPIAGSVRDLALAYAVMAGPDPQDPFSQNGPAPCLRRPSEQRLSGLRLGIFSPWFEDAADDVVSQCRNAVEALTEAGLHLQEVEIPDLHLVRSVHLVTIVSEMASAHDLFYARHRQDYGLDTRLNLALGRSLTSRDFVHAQRLRNQIRARFDEVFSQVDLLVTPTTGITAPPHEADAVPHGESDLPKTMDIMRFAQAANLTGYPAITIPVGFDRSGKPIGLQLMARAFDESLLLNIASLLESRMPRKKAQVQVRLLD